MALSVLITRPLAEAEAFRRLLEARFPAAFEPVIAPLTAIRPVDAELDLAGAGGLVFTSVNAVQQFATRWDARRMVAYCVGETTARAAAAAGFAAVPAGGDVGDLQRAILAAAPAGRLIHLRGRHVAGDLAGNLRGKGVSVESIVIYDQPALPIEPATADRLAAGGVDVATFFSPRAAVLFAAASGHWNLHRTVAICLSANVAAKLAPRAFAGRRPAATATSEGMLAELGRLI